MPDMHLQHAQRALTNHRACNKSNCRNCLQNMLLRVWRICGCLSLHLICYIQISPRHKIAILNLLLSIYTKVSLRKYLKLSLHLSSKNTFKYTIRRIFNSPKSTNRSHLLELLSDSFSKTYKGLLMLTIMLNTFGFLQGQNFYPSAFLFSIDLINV